MLCLASFVSNSFLLLLVRHLLLEAMHLLLVANIVYTYIYISTVLILLYHLRVKCGLCLNVLVLHLSGLDLLGLLSLPRPRLSLLLVRLVFLTQVH